MINTTRLFDPSDRYAFDFVHCSIDKGWAQVDTKQDASYYGTWTNPTERKTVCYCEGDVTIPSADTDEEYIQSLMETVNWNQANGYWRGIDPGFNAALKSRFTDLGLAGLLH